MVLLAFIMIYPLWYCVAGSLNEGMDYLRGGVFLWPRKWTLANYKIWKNIRYSLAPSSFADSISSEGSSRMKD